MSNRRAAAGRTKPTYEPYDSCENHDEPGACTDECVALVQMMSSGYSEGVDYDPTGCSYPPPMPELVFGLDTHRRMVVAHYEHPVGCQCGLDDCPAYLAEDEAQVWCSEHGKDCSFGCIR